MNHCEFIAEMKALVLEIEAQLPSLNKQEIKEKMDYLVNRFTEFQNSECV